jgi:hypothetical protein
MKLHKEKNVGKLYQLVHFGNREDEERCTITHISYYLLPLNHPTKQWLTFRTGTYLYEPLLANIHALADYDIIFLYILVESHVRNFKIRHGCHNSHQIANRQR